MLVYKQNPCNQQSVTRWGSSRCCKTGWQRRRLHREMSSGMFLFGSVTCHESPLSALSALVLMRFERVCLCVSQCVSWRAVLTLFCFFCLSRSSRTRRRRLHHLVLHRPWVTIVLFSGLKICAVQKKKMGVRGGPELRMVQHWNFRETLHVLRIRIIERLSENFTGPLSHLTRANSD